MQRSRSRKKSVYGWAVPGMAAASSLGEQLGQQPYPRSGAKRTVSVTVEANAHGAVAESSVAWLGGVMLAPTLDWLHNGLSSPLQGLISLDLPFLAPGSP